MKKLILSLAASALLILPGQTLASEGGNALKHAHISMDKETLRRGLEVFTNVCMGCHSAKYVTYRDLMDYPELSLTREEVDALRGDAALLDGLRTQLAEADAKEAYGKVPPDLSVIARGRRGGAHYIYSILTGYDHDPAGKIPDGAYNTFFPGNALAMPDPLAWLDHDAADTAELEKQAQDVASFLEFIGDPHQNQRKAIGVWVLGFLVLLTLVLYALKREVWKDIKHH